MSVPARHTEHTLFLHAPTLFARKQFLLNRRQIAPKQRGSRWSMSCGRGGGTQLVSPADNALTERGRDTFRLMKLRFPVCVSVVVTGWRNEGSNTQRYTLCSCCCWGQQAPTDFSGCVCPLTCVSLSSNINVNNCSFWQSFALYFQPSMWSHLSHYKSQMFSCQRPSNCHKLNSIWEDFSFLFFEVFKLQTEDGTHSWNTHTCCHHVTYG